MQHIYLAFDSVDNAEKAIGALMDHGADQSDISAIANDSYYRQNHPADFEKLESAVEAGKEGISTTTGSDAAAGAAGGAAIGAGAGTLAALAALFIPGVGLVLGGGALAVAAAGVAASAGAGAIAGGVTGYLKDMGMDDHVAEKHGKTVEDGGAIIAVAMTDDNNLTLEDIEMIAEKYRALSTTTTDPTARVASNEPATRSY